jgi:uncharacterized protein (DUF305 family)
LIDKESIMTRSIRFLVIALATLFAPLAAQAQSGSNHQHKGHGAPAAATSKPDAPSTKAFKEAHDKMMRDMDIDYTGDADVDFVRGMIPHHQAAIDAAKIVLRYGKNPENQALAKAIIVAQEREIAEMQAWLKKYAK